MRRYTYRERKMNLSANGTFGPRHMPIPPADQWTIVSDPPNDLRTFMCFDTEAAARKCLQGLRANGHGEHLTLTPPRAGAKEIL